MLPHDVFFSFQRNNIARNRRNLLCRSEYHSDSILSHDFSPFSGTSVRNSCLWSAPWHNLVFDSAWKTLQIGYQQPPPPHSASTPSFISPNNPWLDAFLDPSPLWKEQIAKGRSRRPQANYAGHEHDLLHFIFCCCSITEDITSQNKVT
jgi:hypothetical protein